jgi:hypothetical protein
MRGWQGMKNRFRGGGRAQAKPEPAPKRDVYVFLSVTEDMDGTVQVMCTSGPEGDGIGSTGVFRCERTDRVRVSVHFAPALKERLEVHVDAEDPLEKVRRPAGPPAAGAES